MHHDRVERVEVWRGAISAGSLDAKLREVQLDLVRHRVAELVAAESAVAEALERHREHVGRRR